MSNAFLEFAKALKSDEQEKRDTTICAPAVDDSASGMVKVQISGSIIELPTEVSVTKGQTVSIAVISGTMLVKGVIGGGDATYDAVATAQSDADYALALLGADDE